MTDRTSRMTKIETSAKRIRLGTVYERQPHRVQNLWQVLCHAWRKTLHKRRQRLHHTNTVCRVW